MIQRTLAFALTSLALAACANGPAVDSDLEEPGFEEGKADGVDYDNWTYFQMVGQDMRRCMAPLCGGMFVDRVNQAKIKCADGTWQKQCYVAQYDFSAIAEGEEAQQLANEAHGGRLIVRGALKKGFYPEFPDVAVLAVTEAWRAATEAAPTGIFYRAHDQGIVCITTPCVSIELTRMNRNVDPVTRVAGADLTKLGASDEVLNGAWQSLRDGSVMMAGKLKKVEGPAGSAYTMITSQLYTRFVSASAAGQSCGGRAGACPEGYFCQFRDHLCGAADGQGECELKPEACPENLEPVCGCDGVTYSNDCFRKGAGAGFGSAGECKVASGCQVGGCGGELCANAGDEAPVSICLVRPTDHCFQEHGVCEQQAAGCGWTPSAELQACLDAATAADQH